MAKAVKKAQKKSSKKAEPQGKASSAAKRKTTSTTKSKSTKLPARHKTTKAASLKETAKNPLKGKPASTPSKAKPTKASNKASAGKKAAKRAAPTPAAKKAASKQPPAKKSASNGKAPKLNVEQVIKEFRTIVNLKPDQLERWLSMPDSKKLGFKDEVKAGTVGHESGRRILKILSKRRDKYTDDDLRHMQTVVGFVQRHRKEKPPGDVFASNWRYSLMNWGHDPMK